MIANILDAHPTPSDVDRGALAECVAACFDCAAICSACADACLGEDEVQPMLRCITLDLVCADICVATGKALARQTAADRAVLETVLAACRDICGQCADECERHGSMHKHCALCADACRRCASACEALLGS